MSQRVQRFVVRAHPDEGHPRFARWQTGTLCLFVGEDDRNTALRAAKSFLAQNKWVVMEFQEKSTLIEDRVRAVGGEVWKAYCEAQRGKIHIVEGMDQLTATKDTVGSRLAPRVTEAFIDSVIIRASGCRFVPQGPQSRLARNADYLLDDYIIDLKSLEEEGLEVESRQDKLAALFRSVLPNQQSIILDPTLLPPEKRREYLDIIGSRIKKHIQSASDQIRQTKLQMGSSSSKGGVILLNSGFSSLPPSILKKQAERCAKKDSTQVEVVVCVSVWLLTNGFDTTMNFHFSPGDSANSTVQKLKKAFWERVNEWMTEFGRSGFKPAGDVTTPMQAVAFERGGIYFSFVPPQLPDSRFVE